MAIWAHRADPCWSASCSCLAARVYWAAASRSWLAGVSIDASLLLLCPAARPVASPGGVLFAAHGAQRSIAGLLLGGAVAAATAGLY